MISLTPFKHGKPPFERSCPEAKPNRNRPNSSQNLTSLTK